MRTLLLCVATSFCSDPLDALEPYSTQSTLPRGVRVMIEDGDEMQKHVALLLGLDGVTFRVETLADVDTTVDEWWEGCYAVCCTSFDGAPVGVRLQFVSLEQLTKRYVVAPRRIVSCKNLLMEL